MFMSRSMPGPSKPLQTPRMPRGFSLVELMVALAIGSIILVALTAIFYTSTVARKETDKSSRQIENGRYAMQVLTDDLRHAGYLSEFDPTLLPPPGAKPDPCATSVGNLNAALTLHVQGVDDVASGTTPTCVSDVKLGTDIVVIRRASTCVRGAANCDAAAAGVPYFQGSLCGSPTELDSSTTTDYFVLDAEPSAGPSPFVKHKRDCATFADIRRYRTHIYFIANNDIAGDGIPTLMRAELGAGAFAVVPLVEGIENLQLEYGIDTDGDGAPDAFTADPDTYACASCAPVTNLRNIVSVRLNMLARNTEASGGFTDNRVYTLGKKADGTDNNFPPSGTGYGDSFKRHAYTSQVRLNNPAARRIVP
jgi:type IV pilus assembly protein PilW